MTKVLRFEDDDVSRDRFMFLYQGLCHSEKGQVTRDPKVLKREGALRLKFEAISAPKVEPPTRYAWVEREPRLPAEVEVDQEDLDMLKDYVPANRWTVMTSDVVADAIDWAWGAPEKKA